MTAIGFGTGWGISRIRMPCPPQNNTTFISHRGGSLRYFRKQFHLFNRDLLNSPSMPIAEQTIKQAVLTEFMPPNPARFIAAFRYQ